MQRQQNNNLQKVSQKLWTSIVHYVVNIEGFQTLSLSIKAKVHLNNSSFHTSELKRIWQTLQEMIGLFVFTTGGPKVCVITAFWTGSIWTEKAQRSDQKFSNTGGTQRAMFFITAVHRKVSPSECGWERREKCVKEKVQVSDRGKGEGGEGWEINKSGEEWIEVRAGIDVDRVVCIFSAAAGVAVCASVLVCCSNALIHGGIRRA